MAEEALKPRILILGAGFGGLDTALALSKHRDELEITIVNKQAFFTYYPSLHEFFSLKTDKEQITIDLNKLCKQNGITFYRDVVKHVDPKEKNIKTEKLTLDYDYLVCALGSVSDEHGIPGLKENALTLKSLLDAQRIHEQLFKTFEALRLGAEKVTILVCGGGLTGIETVFEVRDYVAYLCKMYGIERSKIVIALATSSDTVLKQLHHPNASAVALAHMKKRGIQFLPNHRVTRVEKGHVEFATLERTRKIGHDCLIWTGGVRAHPLAEKIVPKVNAYLQSTEHKSIFAVGDAIDIQELDPETRREIPFKSAQNARLMAKVVAKNVYNDSQNRALFPFTPSQTKVVVSLGKNYAVLTDHTWMLKGFIPYQMKMWIRRLYMLFRRHFRRLGILEP